jgi:hypothetical protein
MKLLKTRTTFDRGPLYTLSKLVFPTDRYVQFKNMFNVYWFWSPFNYFHSPRPAAGEGRPGRPRTPTRAPASPTTDPIPSLTTLPTMLSLRRTRGATTGTAVPAASPAHLSTTTRSRSARAKTLGPRPGWECTATCRPPAAAAGARAAAAGGVGAERIESRPSHASL